MGCRLWQWLAAAAWLAVASPATAYDKLVEPQVFTYGHFTTARGELVLEMKVSWEAYGRLSYKADNAIIIAPPFATGAHAAGRYADDDPAPGYWDAIIGPGLALDTDKYFVLSIGAPCAVAAQDPHAVTTGPASLDPDTGEPYGSAFPALTLRDFVTVQKAVAQRLGIGDVEAVIGFGMGAAQAIEWGVAYPHAVKRVIAVAPWAEAGAWQLAGLYAWTAPILRDPAWQGGDYHGGPAPVAGLAGAYEILLRDSLAPGFLETRFGRAWADESLDPGAAPGALYAAEAWLRDTARTMAEAGEASHFVCQARAMRQFVAGHRGPLDETLKRLTAKTLLLSVAGDRILPPALADAIAARLRAAGNTPELAQLPGAEGHAEGRAAIAAAADRIAAFLAD